MYLVESLTTLPLLVTRAGVEGWAGGGGACLARVGGSAGIGSGIGPAC